MEDEDGKKKNPKGFGLSSQHTDRQTDRHTRKQSLVAATKEIRNGGGVGVGADREQTDKSIPEGRISYQSTIGYSFSFNHFIPLLSLLSLVCCRGWYLGCDWLGCDLVGWRRVSFLRCLVHFHRRIVPTIHPYLPKVKREDDIPYHASSTLPVLLFYFFHHL